MRQLGARLPEPPRNEAPQETRRFDQPEEAPRFEETRRFEDLYPETPRSQPDSVPLEHHELFQELTALQRQLFQDRPAGPEAVPRQEGKPWGLLETEKEHRFPFVTIAVPAVAALLALGALLWSGSMRDRLRQQDAAMNALQTQNQKMADTLEEMSVEQKASSALSSSSGLQQSAQPTPANRQQSVSKTVPPPQTAPTQPAEPPHTVTQPQQAAGPPLSEKGQSATLPQRATPPGTASAENRGSAEYASSGQAKPVETARAPELVPPYPTNYSPLKATSVAPPSNAAQGASQNTGSVYHAPFSVSGGTTSNQTQPAASSTRPNATPAAPPVVHHAPASPDQYDAAGNGLYASSLAQNIEAVQGLQRHSTVPLQEFHVHDGMLTKLTPGLGLSVKHPDAGHGTYSLTVDGGGSSYQLRGQVNNPLVFTDNATHREYELVVLRIADRQVYGYVRAMR